VVKLSMSPIERHVLKSATPEADRLKSLYRDNLSSIERAAIEAAKRYESDPAIRAARMLESDPMRQAERMMRSTLHERHFEEKRRMLESLDTSSHPIKQAMELQRSLGTRATIERSGYSDSPMQRPMPDLRPQRDYHLEALTDIKQSLRTQAQERAESVKTAIVDHIRQKQEGLGDDQELVVYWEGIGERFQVRQFTLPNHHTVILEGLDAQGNEVSRIVTLNNVEISSKIVTIAAPQKPYRIGFTTAD
jgi:hypothetical protein